MASSIAGGPRDATAQMAGDGRCDARAREDARPSCLNAECRMPKEIRGSKAEAPARAGVAPSEFGIRAFFGIRHSAFGIPVMETEGTRQISVSSELRDPSATSRRRQLRCAECLANTPRA